MENNLVKQWIDLNTAILDSFKGLVATNTSTGEQMLANIANPSAYAELSQSSIKLVKEVGQVYTDSINELFQAQLKLVNLQTTSENIKGFRDIYVSSMTQLGEKQAELLGLRFSNCPSGFVGYNSRKAESEYDGNFERFKLY